MEPQHISVTERPVFLKEYFTNTAYQIPVYQREYVWSEKIVVDFLENLISEKDFQYTFFGIVILKKLRSKGLTKNEIIDGQQRSVSFQLILKLLSIYANDNFNNNKAIILRLREVNDLLLKEGSPVVTPSKNDKHLFNAILNSRTLEDFNNALKNNREFSKRHLYRNASRIMTYIQDEALTQKSWLRVINNLLCKVYLITITVTSSQNANQLFKSFNQKRIPLLLSDLLRNDVYIAGLKYKLREAEIIKVLEELNSIFLEISKNNKISAEEFLFYFINSMAFTVSIFGKKQFSKPLGSNKLYDAFEWLINEYYKGKLRNFIFDLKQTWDCILPLIDPAGNNNNHFLGKEGKVKKDHLEEFTYLFALRAFNIKKGLHIILAAKIKYSKQKYLNILRTTTYFSIRHTFTPKDMKLLEGWLAEAALVLFKTKSPLNFRKELEKYATVQYQKGITKNFGDYEFSNTRAKALLLLLALRDKNFDYMLKDKFSDIEIEHIWPDKPIDKYFRSMNVDRSVYDANKRRIGNLILCPQVVNGAVKNKPFDEKLRLYKKYQNKIYHCSKFVLNTKIWSEQKISERTNKLQNGLAGIN